MKKFLIFVLFLFTISMIYIIYDKYKIKEEEKVIPINGSAYVDDYYIYGTHFNISGYLDNIPDINDIKLVLYNNEIESDIPITYELIDEKIIFNISNEINNGYYLDNVSTGNNYLLLKILFEDETFKYYRLENNTKYNELIYYTLSNVGNKIVINSINKYNTFLFNVSKNHDDNIYDITIDPGHGGKDPGACSKGNCEKEIVLDYGKKLKEKLESLGYKVKLTRDSDVTLESYNMNDVIGRAVIPNHTNSKYLFSVHLNSHTNKKMHGVEILTPSNINYTFAKSLANKIVEYTNTSYSINKGYKVYDGVYTRVFTDNDVQTHIDENGDLAYDAKKGASYYYMIRETGGSLTGAYVDDRNIENGENPYYNSNKGVESYIMELGYIINSEDVTNIINNKDKYINAITDAIKENLTF